MGVFEKLKNVFFEEEEIEIEEPIRKPKKEKNTIAKKVDLPEMPIIKDEKTTREKQLEEEVFERVERKKISDEIKKDDEKEFSFPMSFEEDDFKIDNYPEENIVEDNKKNNFYEELDKPKNVYNEKTYNNKHEEEKRDYTASGLYEGGISKKEQKVFRPTPIISPIYGILDKNYKKDEIVQKKEIRLTSATSKKVDLDTVREKAYGDLANDITSSMMDEAPKKKEQKQKEGPENDALYDLNDMEHPVVSNVTVGDAEEYYNDLGLEYNVDYKENKSEKPVGRRSEKKQKEEASEDSLFDLIDSMYKDSEEE